MTRDRLLIRGSGVRVPPGALICAGQKPYLASQACPIQCHRPQFGPAEVLTRHVLTVLTGPINSVFSVGAELPLFVRGIIPRRTMIKRARDPALRETEPRIHAASCSARRAVSGGRFHLLSNAGGIWWKPAPFVYQPKGPVLS
jgi:hypothetical protein